MMEQYLQSYVSSQQDESTWFLVMAELAANNHVSVITGASPSFAYQGFYPHMNL